MKTSHALAEEPGLGLQEFNYLNENKLGIELPPADPRVLDLAGHADIIIHSERGPAGDRTGMTA